MGYAIVLVIFMYLDYKIYLRGNKNTWFFEDKTEIEKDLREIQRLETKKKLRNLQNE